MPRYKWHVGGVVLANVIFCIVAGRAAESIDIGSRRELFVDSFLIDDLAGVQLKLQTPRPAGVAIRYDQPWEGHRSFYTTVFRDDNIYRMYYRGLLRSAPISTTCYAESRDGIHWTKPELGIVEFNGSKANNIILPISSSFCPFKDKRPGVPKSERYKANAAEGNPRHLVGWVSGDGIHWRRLEDRVLVPAEFYNNFDSQNVMFWSEVEECYVLYSRHMNEKRRATARATSKDFLTWTKQTPVTYSDTGTALPSAHLYTSQTHPYFRAPHIYISLPARIFFGDLHHISRPEDIAAASRRVLTPPELAFFKTNTRGDSGGPTDVSDAVFLTTRAGSLVYDFTFKESFIRPGVGYSHWQSRTNYPVLGVVQTSPMEMSLYMQRNYGQKTAHLERFVLRVDGFASVHAPFAGGEMVTKPFTFTGARLEINYATSAAGFLRVEIQNANGTPLDGYSLADCPHIIGDEIERTLAWGEIPAPRYTTNSAGRKRLVVAPWTGNSDVSRLAGKPIRLRFVMKDADLFSLRFQ